MKAITKRRQQWAWFLALWCAGLSAALLLSGLIRWLLRLLSAPPG